MDTTVDGPAAAAEYAAKGGKTRLRDSPLERLFDLCSPEERKEYEPERRSLRIDGHCTTIRLERAFWSVLDAIASDEGRSIPEIIAQVQYRCQSVNDRNLASCLRVLCLKYINTCAWAAAPVDLAASAKAEPAGRIELDTRGLNCPQPILKTKNALRGMQNGQELRVLTTDPGSAMDFDVFCRTMGHQLVWNRESDGVHVFLIKKCGETS